MPRVRPATPADIPAMLNLEGLAPSAGHWTASQYEAIFAPGSSRLALIIEDHAGGNGFLVAHGTGGEWELENLVVAAEVRRLGFGNQLAAALIEILRARSAEVVFLEVRESNRAARSLYEKNGFAEMGRRRHYYSNPQEDAVQYRLSITAQTT